MAWLYSGSPVADAVVFFIFFALTFTFALVDPGVLNWHVPSDISHKCVAHISLPIWCRYLGQVLAPCMWWDRTTDGAIKCHIAKA